MIYENRTLSNYVRPEEFVVEFCPWSIFNASCPDSSYILVSSAYFGRMHDSEACAITTSAECVTDVSGYLDRLCGLQSNCEFNVGEKIHLELGSNGRCRNLNSFLEVTFICITGMN